MTWLDVGGQKSKVKVTPWFKYVVMKTSTSTRPSSSCSTNSCV